MARKTDQRVAWGWGRLLRPLAGLRETLEGGVDGGSVAAGVSSPDARPPPLFFPLEELLPNEGVNENEFICQMTRFVFMGPMRCVPASWQDEWSQP